MTLKILANLFLILMLACFNLHADEKKPASFYLTGYMGHSFDETYHTSAGVSTLLKIKKFGIGFRYFHYFGSEQFQYVYSEAMKYKILRNSIELNIGPVFLINKIHLNLMPYIFAGFLWNEVQYKVNYFEGEIERSFSNNIKHSSWYPWYGGGLLALRSFDIKDNWVSIVLGADFKVICSLSMDPDEIEGYYIDYGIIAYEMGVTLGLKFF